MKVTFQKYLNNVEEDMKIRLMKNNQFINVKNISKRKVNKVGLLYLLLGIDGTIMYIGSSKDISNDRLLQSDRMRGPYEPNHVTANTIGYEYGKSIFYAVKFIVSDYHNLEHDLIYRLKPKYNTLGKKNYISKWDNLNYSFINPPSFVLNFINDICIDGKFNASCNHEYELLHVVKLMTDDMINSTYRDLIGEVA